MKKIEKLATSAEVAECLGVSVRTLDEWAWRKTGPRYARIGRHRRYRWRDVERYLEQQSQGGEAA